MEELMHIWVELDSENISFDPEMRLSEVPCAGFEVRHSDSQGDRTRRFAAHWLDRHEDDIRLGVISACDTRQWNWSMRKRDGFYWATVEDGAGDVFEVSIPVSISTVTYCILHAYVRALQHQVDVFSS